MVKNPPANSGDLRDMGSIPGSERSPGGRHGNPLQYSCQKNPMDRGAWQATVHSIAKSWTWLKRLSVHANIYIRWGKSWEFTSCCHSRTQDDGSSATHTMWFPRCLWAFISNWHIGEDERVAVCRGGSYVLELETANIVYVHTSSGKNSVIWHNLDVRK